MAKAPRLAPAAAAVCVLAAAAVAWEPAWPAHAPGGAQAKFDIYHGGALVEDGRISPMMASGEPITVELRYVGHLEMGADRKWAFHEFPAPGGRGAPAISMDVTEWGRFGKGHAGPAPAPTLVDRGDGTATLTVDRSAPTDGEIRLSAGEAGSHLRIHVLPPPPPPGYGSPDGPPQPPPRIAAQARLPLCADAAHGAAVLDPASHGDDLRHMHLGEHMSGVPPIEGMVHQEGEYEVPVGEPKPWWDWPGWDCHTWASYGTQAPQLLRLCEIPGRDRIHHYTRHPYDSTASLATRMISPYTGYFTTLSSHPTHTYAAAPGPYWDYMSRAGVPIPYLPDVDVPPAALHSVMADGTAATHLTRVTGTFSSVPELLPFDDVMVIRATAFHADDVAFEVSDWNLGLPREGALARVNGTSVPVEVVESESALGTFVRVPVRVSEVAWASGILVRGITDEHATAASIVRDLHEVTLVAEIPVDAGGGIGYGRLDPSESVEPWGCWPREEGEPMRVGSREAWPAEPNWGARIVPHALAGESVAMGGTVAGRLQHGDAPALVGVRAPGGWGEGTAISARVYSSSAWPPSNEAVPPPRIDVADRGDGTAVIAVDAPGPGVHVLSITAAGPPGTATEAHVLRVAPPGQPPLPPNLEPEISVLVGGEPADVAIDLAASREPARIGLRADDPEGDRVWFMARASDSTYGNAPSRIRLGDYGNGTAYIHVDRHEPGELVIHAAAADAHGESWATRLVRVLPPPEQGVYRDGLRVGPPLVELPVSAVPVPLEAHAGPDGGDVSARVLRSSHWGGGEAPGPPRVEASGGSAAVWVDASAPGEHLVEVSGAGGAELYVIRVLPAAHGPGR